MSAVLSNIKVVEVASVLAGPAVGMFLAERGAKVIKVENKKTGGDVTRSWKLPTENSETNVSAYFCAVNWNKEHIFLDLTDETDKAQLSQLIREADILIANFKFGDAEKFNLDFETVRTLNPRIIHAELSGFGSKEKRVAYDLVLQAETGFMFMNGTPESGPVKMPLAMIDILAAHQLKEGILEALIGRSISGQAYHVEVSLYDAAVSSLANQGSNYLMENYIPQPMGSMHPNISPYGETFKTKDDQFITLAVGNDKQFERLLNVLKMKSESDFETNKNRVANRVRLAELLEEKIKDWNSEDLCSTLIELDVPAARINNLEQVFTNPKAEALILEEEIGGVKTKRVRSAAYKITAV